MAPAGCIASSTQNGFCRRQGGLAIKIDHEAMLGGGVGEEPPMGLLPMYSEFQASPIAFRIASKHGVVGTAHIANSDDGTVCWLVWDRPQRVSARMTASDLRACAHKYITIAEILERLASR